MEFNRNVVVGLILVVVALAFIADRRNAVDHLAGRPAFGKRMQFDSLMEERIRQRIDLIESKSEPWTEDEKMCWAILWLDIEICNGGVEQYFYNSAGELSLETVEWLHRINARNTSSLLRQACNAFPNQKPAKNTEERRKQLETFSAGQLESLDRLSEQYYCRSEDIFALLEVYLLAQENSDFKPEPKH